MKNLPSPAIGAFTEFRVAKEEPQNLALVADARFEMSVPLPRWFPAGACAPGAVLLVLKMRVPARCQVREQRRRETR